MLVANVRWNNCLKKDREFHAEEAGWRLERDMDRDQDKNIRYQESDNGMQEDRAKEAEENGRKRAKRKGWREKK